MRTLRLPLVGTVMVVLLVGTSGMTVAQESGPVTWTYVTGTMTDAVEGPGPSEVTEWTGSVEHTRGVSREVTIDWSDPRLPPTMVTTTNFDMHHGDMDRDDFALLWSQTHRLDDSDGYWTGTEHGYAEGEHGQAALIILTGEDAYDGLSAVLQAKTIDGVTTYEGLIFEGEMPPFPEPDTD